MRDLGNEFEEHADEILEFSHMLADLGKKLKGDSTKPCQINQEETENMRHALRYYGEACIYLSKFVVPVAKTRTISTTGDRIFNRTLLVERDQ